MRIIKMDTNRTEQRIVITVLFRNASARYSAPLSPISLLLISNVMSVCESIWQMKRETKTKIVPNFLLILQLYIVWLDPQVGFVSVSMWLASTLKIRSIIWKYLWRNQITLSFRNVMAIPTAIARSLLLPSNWSFVSVYKTTSTNIKEMKNELDSLYSLEMHHADVVPRLLQFYCI
jgi:hypothetical protein